MITYSTKGTCSKQIVFDLDDEHRIHNVKFIGGCSGNLQGISKLVEGRTAEEIVPLLKGIRCPAPISLQRRSKNSSTHEDNRKSALLWESTFFAF